MAYTEMLVTWNGASGLPGYSKFRFIGELSGSTLNTAAANLRVLLDAVKAYIPSIVTLSFSPGATWHSDDGTLTAEVAIGSLPANVAGTGAGAYLSATGFLIFWNTGAINGGKKVRGRTYFVPTPVSIAQSDGSVIETARTIIQAAATAFATSTPSPAINSRARPGNPAAGNQTVSVISATVPDKQVILRSRRD
jgi:hypothetical protein